MFNITPVNGFTMHTTLFIFVAAFSLTAVVYATNKSCSSYQTCQECTTKMSQWFGRRCQWCPISRDCHITGSILSACKQRQIIHDAGKCYDLTPGVYNSNSAYTNTMLSAVAYSSDPKKCLDKIFPGNGIEIVRKTGSKCEDSNYFKYKQCFAYTAVSHASRIIIVAFRGTTVRDQLIDEFWSTLTIPLQHFIIGGKVQSYFKHAYDGLYPSVNESVHTLVKKHPAYQVVVTGHSLGGALASLASAALVYHNVVPKSKMTLYTFGQPRVGDRAYAVSHEKLVNDSWRVVHYRDIVSHLPNCDVLLGCAAFKYTPFHHGIEIFYPHEYMGVRSEYKQCRKDEDRSCSDGLVTKQPCITDMQPCLECHRYYFGIEVGDICKNVGAF